MAVKYEVTAVTGKYTDREGKEKNRYAKLGVIMSTKNGFMLKLESVPLQWDGWAYLNEPRKDEAPAAKKADRGGIEDLDDQIPF